MAAVLVTSVDAMAQKTGGSIGGSSRTSGGSGSSSSSFSGSGSSRSSDWSSGSSSFGSRSNDSLLDRHDPFPKHEKTEAERARDEEYARVAAAKKAAWNAAHRFAGATELTAADSCEILLNFVVKPATKAVVLPDAPVLVAAFDASGRELGRLEQLRHGLHRDGLDRHGHHRHGHDRGFHLG